MSTSVWSVARALLVALAWLAPSAAGAPVLNLAIDGPDHASSPAWVTIEIVAANTDFSLGGLSYSLEFSISGSATSVWVTSREYAAHGWVANDGLFDNSVPAQGTGLSEEVSKVRFDTVLAPAGDAREAGASGIVETLGLQIPAGLPDGTVLDVSLVGISASDGLGNDLVTYLGGSAPAPLGLQITVPEPLSMVLLGMGGLAAIRLGATGGMQAPAAP